MRIALAQVNPTVGDIHGNMDLLQKATIEAESNGADLIAFPELVLTGYPPEDLLFKPAFIRDNIAGLKAFARSVKTVPAVVGFVDEKKGKLFNAAAWIEKGKVRAVYHKHCLPNYGVFDEKRYFSKGHLPLLKTVNGVRVGITICEDIWGDNLPLKRLKQKRPDIILNLSASPFHAGKKIERQKVAARAAKSLKTHLAYLNMAGAQDELVFDGGSFLTSPKGRTTVQFPQFQEGNFYSDINKEGRSIKVTSSQNETAPLSMIEEVYRALLSGIENYVHKNDFKKITLGLSGGIDSALVAALAVKALGPEKVIGVTMPSRYNKSETRIDAEVLAKNLKVKLLEIPIEPLFEKFLDSLAPAFAKAPPNITEENLQARIRGTLLMSLSNKFSWLVLTTGNKSETSTGYCTLYGDTAGGFAVLKDVVKTKVYQLAKLINEKEGRDIIPKSIIKRPPTAELKENQKDEDSLGSYAELDPIIEGYIEKNQPINILVRNNPGREAYARRIVSLIDHNEYKRRQAPPGIKITPRSFGRDHRMPITNRYKSS